MAGKTGDDVKVLQCSFCEATEEAVSKLICGEGGSICDRCLDRCNEIMIEESGTLWPWVHRPKAPGAAARPARSTGKAAGPKPGAGAKAKARAKAGAKPSSRAGKSTARSRR
ncbi:MAG: hypothetical protein HY815_06410 [Candidatus Riflebacteria bacterium]|nr:hypothetical protein [Candidatus Riflebacteria bacterium]